MVLSVLWIPKLVDKELYAIGRRAKEAEAAQMAHLFAFYVVQSIGEVYRVVKKRGLCGCRG